jgi:hypothetical protein
VRSDRPAPRRRSLVAALAALALALTGAPLRAEPPVTGAEARADAQRLFEQGLALLDAGDRERALDHFLRSRALAPGKGNTANAAHCLHALGRFDEALELYEELLARFAGELRPENRERLVPAMAELRGRVGSVAITANVEGSVLVDGRLRGRLPLAGAVRVLGGRHLVRVLKDGYGTFERLVEVRAGEVLPVDAVLRPLEQAGQLRLEDPENAGADVFVDRVRVGTVPWEGTLGPGEHLVWDAGATRGSAPARAVVVQGQGATLRLRSAPLGPAATLAVEPSTAEIRLDDVALGTGSWSGRPPLGAHAVVVAEPGYVPRAVTLVAAAGGAPVELRVALAVDPAHPRWPKGPTGALEIELLAGAALGASLHSDAEAWCSPACGRAPRVTGAMMGARAGFRFRSGVSLEIAGGYVTVGSSLTRAREAAFPSPGATVSIAYDLHDALRLRGPFVGAGPGYRVPFAGRFALVSHVLVGAVIGGVTDSITGQAVTTSGAAGLRVTNRDAQPSERLSATALLVAPELAVEVHLGGLRVGAGLGVVFLTGSGPSFRNELLHADRTTCSPATPSAAGCAPAQAWLKGERAFRPFTFALPTVSVGYTF